MLVKVTMVENEIREAISLYVFNKYGLRVSPQALGIQVKSKQNYKSEWEEAAIRVDADAPAVDRKNGEFDGE